MSQQRKHSMIEVSLNTASGFAISYIAGLLIFPALGFPITHRDNFIVVCAYTIISLGRSYFWRRVFNWYHASGEIDIQRILE